MKVDKYKERCRYCICLVGRDKGKWVCDEAGKDIHEVLECPEGLELIDKILYCERCGYEAAERRFEKGGDLEREGFYNRALGSWFICPECNRGPMIMPHNRRSTLRIK